jgi:hypothetical protein
MSHYSTSFHVQVAVVTHKDFHPDKNGNAFTVAEIRFDEKGESRSELSIMLPYKTRLTIKETP